MVTVTEFAARVENQVKELAAQNAGKPVFIVALSFDGARVQLLVVPHESIHGVVPPDVAERLLHTAGTPGTIPAAFLIPDSPPLAVLVPTGTSLGPTA